MRPKKAADWSCKAPILAPAPGTLNSPVLCPQTAQHLHLSGLPGANTEAAPNSSAPSWPTLQCLSMVTRHAPGDQGKLEIISPQDETLSGIPAPRCLYYFCTCIIITQPTNAPKKCWRLLSASAFCTCLQLTQQLPGHYPDRAECAQPAHILGPKRHQVIAIAAHATNLLANIQLWSAS